MKETFVRDMRRLRNYICTLTPYDSISIVSVLLTDVQQTNTHLLEADEIPPLTHGIVLLVRSLAFGVTQGERDRKSDTVMQEALFNWPGTLQASAR